MLRHIPSDRSMDRDGERKQSVVVVQGLDGPLSAVASLLGYIDALHIDHDLGCLNLSEVRYAKRNIAFAIKRYKQLL